MHRRLCSLLLVWVLFGFLPAASAYGQGSVTSSLAGVVVDSNGGAVPGATVAIKNNGTGVTLQLVTNESGAFSAPSLDAGTYT